MTELHHWFSHQCSKSVARMGTDRRSYYQRHPGTSLARPWIMMALSVQYSPVPQKLDLRSLRRAIPSSQLKAQCLVCLCQRIESRILMKRIRRGCRLTAAWLDTVLVMDVAYSKVQHDDELKSSGTLETADGGKTWDADSSLNRHLPLRTLPFVSD